MFSCCAFGPIVPEELCQPGHLYKSSRVDPKKLTRLILEGKLCPIFRGLDDPAPLPQEHDFYVQVLTRVFKKKQDKHALKLLTCIQEYEPCPVCLLHYICLNTSRCCRKRVCTECYLQVQTFRTTPSACPFCKVPGFSARFMGLKTLESREAERLEEQQVIAARIREREEEIQRDKEREERREQQRLAVAAQTSDTAALDAPSSIPTAVQRPASPPPDSIPSLNSPRSRPHTGTPTSRRSSTSATAAALSHADAVAQQGVGSSAAPHNRIAAASHACSTHPRQRRGSAAESPHAEGRARGHNADPHNARYRVTDYVPGTFASIGLNLDDINDIMLEQAVYESLRAAETPSTSGRDTSHSTVAAQRRPAVYPSPVSFVPAPVTTTSAFATSQAQNSATPASGSPTGASPRVVSPALPPINTRVRPDQHSQTQGVSPAHHAPTTAPAMSLSSPSGVSNAQSTVQAPSQQVQHIASISTLSDDEQLALAIQLSLAASMDAAAAANVPGVTANVSDNANDEQGCSMGGARDQTGPESKGPPCSGVSTSSSSQTVSNIRSDGGATLAGKPDPSSIGVGVSADGGAVEVIGAAAGGREESMPGGVAEPGLVSVAEEAALSPPHGQQDIPALVSLHASSAPGASAAPATRIDGVERDSSSLGRGTSEAGVVQTGRVAAGAERVRPADDVSSCPHPAAGPLPYGMLLRQNPAFDMSQTSSETNSVHGDGRGPRGAAGDAGSSAATPLAARTVVAPDVVGALAAAVAANQPATFHLEMMVFRHTTPQVTEDAQGPSRGPEDGSTCATVEAFVTDVPSQRASHKSNNEAALQGSQPGLLVVQNPDGSVCSVAAAPAAAAVVPARAGTAAYEQQLLARDRRELSQMHRRIVVESYQDHHLPDEGEIAMAEYQDYDVVGYDAPPLEASDMDSSLAVDAQVQQSIDARDARLRAAYRR